APASDPAHPTGGASVDPRNRPPQGERGGIRIRRQEEGTIAMYIGFVGLGAMGALMVPRHMAAGHAVTGMYRSPGIAAPLTDGSMAFADTPRAMAKRSEIVLSCVTDAPAVKAVALGPDGIVAGLKPGGIYIDMSTIDPEASRAVAA